MTTNLLRSAISFGIASAATMLLVAGSAAPVRAETAPVAEISTSGIDLASTAGVERLTREIRAAARRICASADHSLVALREADKCTRTALASALPKLQQMAEDARAGRAFAEAAGTTARN